MKKEYMKCNKYQSFENCLFKLLKNTIFENSIFLMKIFLILSKKIESMAHQNFLFFNINYFLKWRLIKFALHVKKLNYKFPEKNIRIIQDIFEFLLSNTDETVFKYFITDSIKNEFDIKNRFYFIKLFKKSSFDHKNYQKKKNHLFTICDKGKIDPIKFIDFLLVLNIKRFDLMNFQKKNRILKKVIIFSKKQFADHDNVHTFSLFLLILKKKWTKNRLLVLKQINKISSLKNIFNDKKISQLHIGKRRFSRILARSLIKSLRDFSSIIRTEVRKIINKNLKKKKMYNLNCIYIKESSLFSNIDIKMMFKNFLQHIHKPKTIFWAKNFSNILYKWNSSKLCTELLHCKKKVVFIKKIKNYEILEKTIDLDFQTQIFLQKKLLPENSFFWYTIVLRNYFINFYEMTTDYVIHKNQDVYENSIFFYITYLYEKYIKKKKNVFKLRWLKNVYYIKNFLFNHKIKFFVSMNINIKNLKNEIESVINLNDSDFLYHIFKYSKKFLKKPTSNIQDRLVLHYWKNARRLSNFAFKKFLISDLIIKTNIDFGSIENNFCYFYTISEIYFNIKIGKISEIRHARLYNRYFLNLIRLVLNFAKIDLKIWKNNVEKFELFSKKKFLNHLDLITGMIGTTVKDEYSVKTKEVSKVFYKIFFFKKFMLKSFKVSSFSDNFKDYNLFFKKINSIEYIPINLEFIEKKKNKTMISKIFQSVIIELFRDIKEKREISYFYESFITEMSFENKNFFDTYACSINFFCVRKKFIENRPTLLLWNMKIGYDNPIYFQTKILENYRFFDEDDFFILRIFYYFLKWLLDNDLMKINRDFLKLFDISKKKKFNPGY